jgi:DNA repair ATPase RecN
MKVKKIKIQNFKLISNAEIEFNKPLICLYGDVEQGKTSFLNAIKLLFQKGFPNDLIKHGQKEAVIELHLENGLISRSFYFNKENEITARPLKAILNNKEMKITELQNLFNPFQLNQDYLKEMTSLERKKFFVELFNVDTAEIDKKINDLKDNAEKLRILISTYGEIDLTPVEQPNIINLQNKENEIRAKYNNIVLEIRAENKILKENWKAENEAAKEEVEKFNQLQNEVAADLKQSDFLRLQLIDFKSTVFENAINYNEVQRIFMSLLRPKDLQTFVETSEPEYRPETDFDTSELTAIQEQISNAKADQIRYENYLKSVEKNNEKTAKQSELKQIEDDLRDLRKQKIAKLQEYGKEIAGLSFNETGDFIFEGTNGENLSTSQIVRLGVETSKLFPKTLIDLELIDRGESLNLSKNINFWIEKAETENKNILMTVVGEKPANLIEKVGIFVVEKGTLLV